MTLQIVQAIPEDLPLILKWTLSLYQHEDDGLLPAADNFEENLSKWLSQQVSAENCLILIAQQHNTPAGFIAASSIINDNGFLKEALKGYIQLIWVDEEHRSQGIAQELLTAVEECFKSIGIHYVECSYIANNQLARNFWDKSGYKLVSETVRKFI